MSEGTKALPRVSRVRKPTVTHTYQVLALLESLTMLICLYIGNSYTYKENDKFFNHLTSFEPITFVLILTLSMAAMGLYHARQRNEPKELLARILISFGLASVVQGVIFYFIPYLSIHPKAIIIGLALSLPMVCLIRYSFSKITASALVKRRVLVLGAGQRAKIIEERMRRGNDKRGFTLLGYIPLSDAEVGITASQQKIVCLEQLLDYAQQHRIDEFIVAADDRRAALPMNELYRCRVAGIYITDIVTFIERECGKIPLNLLNPSWLIYSRGYISNDALIRAQKRIFDVAISLIMLVATSPIMFITALLIMLEGSPGSPLFYSQERIGLGNRPFKIFKFRSMRVDAEADGAVWAKKNDDRVTAVGAFIRKYRIDELPQLLNVLRGEMSFIGPRPERTEFVARLTQRIPYYGDRHLVKPGLTGWAQICYDYGGTEDGAMEKLQYDLYYIKNFSFMLDIMIMIGTMEVVLFGQGSR
ncbi:MAG: sugar transferase (PEP-CTERM system associated) [Motiliproteus sp.]|jgi:sugar transferase (PEP-CTERM system associated)